MFAGNSLAAPYAQLSSSQNQLGSTTPKVVELNQNDAVKGIANSNGVVMFKEPGAYFVMAAAQVGSADGKGQGTLHLWMRKNGKDVANSNSVQTIVPGFTAVLISQGVVEIEPADTMEMVYSVSTAAENLGLIASTPSGEPMVPSMIFTAFKVDDSAYAQISGSQTQTAVPTGSPIMLNTVDAAKNIENKAGAITFKTAGTYFVMAAGQVGCTASGEQGRVRLWLLQNGLAMSNSNCEQAVSPGFTAVLVCQGVMACKAGDRLEFIQSASGSGMGMIASAPEGESTVPSVIVSIIKVADDAYAQLSSVESQASASYAKLVRLNQTDAAQISRTRVERGPVRSIKAPLRSIRTAFTLRLQRPRSAAPTAKARDRCGCGCARGALTSASRTPSRPSPATIRRCWFPRGSVKPDKATGCNFFSPPEGRAWA